MHLRRLELEQYRVYDRLDLGLDRAGLCVVGANASGKSSLLEAIVMLATTRSPRSGSDRETIRWGSGDDLGVPPFARLRGEVVTADRTSQVEIALQADLARPGFTRKTIKINGRPVRAVDAVGRLKAVLFAPEDVALVNGTPSQRRRYLDLTISQTDPGYLRALSRYNRVLEQRNSLLKSLQRAGASPSAAHAVGQLAFWDEQLLGFGTTLVTARVGRMARLGPLAASRYASLAQGQLSVNYLPALPLPLVDVDKRLDEDWLAGAVRRTFERVIEERRGEEIRRGATIVGPHRDDFGFAIDGNGVAEYGSRGQQRLAVIALKLAETALMSEVSGEPPVLLLDDVLSELDARHRAQLESTAAVLDAQVIVTGTDATEWSGTTLARLPAARVACGVLTPVPTAAEQTR